MTADIAAPVATIGADAAIAAVAAQDASVADESVAGYDLNHRRGAWLSVYRGGLVHGLHTQHRFGRRPYG